MPEHVSGSVLVTGASVDERYLNQLRAAGLKVINPALRSYCNWGGVAVF
jgi:hypothetical protein